MGTQNLSHYRATRKSLTQARVGAVLETRVVLSSGCSKAASAADVVEVEGTEKRQ